MEPLNAAGRHSVGLPPINNLAADSVKREEMEYQRKHSNPAMVSPLHPFHGPSHPYSNHQSAGASSLSGPLGGLLSPPTSRRTSDDEKDHQRPPPPRQSLPSIHEALGKEPPSLPYPPPPPPSAPASAAQSFFPPSSAAAPAEPPRTRTFSVDHINNPIPPNLFTQPPRSPFPSKPTATAPPPPTTHAPSDLARSSYPASSSHHNSKLPALHPLRTTQSPPIPASRPNPPYPPYPPPQSSVHEPPAPHSAGPMNSQYGYSPYGSNYPQSAPAPGAPTSAYPASASYSAPPRYPPTSWRPENPEYVKQEEKKASTLATYGALVKRHLEKFDFEASLNEMSEGAGRVAEFSKTYRERAHNSQRTGITQHSIPSVGEVDEMLKQSEKIQFSLTRIRDVVVSHQQANQMETSREGHYRQNNGYDYDGQNSFQEDSKGGTPFGGLDPNKRTKRGRAAPPGKCHSCSRVETPEWRRGPDGARTLCNACGLHYAKMSRKTGKQPTNAQVGWQRAENLRPKGSPAA